MYREWPYQLDGAVVWTSDGSDPGGSDPGGSDPGGSDPGGSDPGGSDPGGSDPGGSEPRDGGEPDDAGDQTSRRVLPDGCLDVIWIDGTLIVAGPDTRAHVWQARRAARYVGVRFRPGQGPGVLGVPADEVRDGRPPLDQVWPAAEVRRLAEVIATAPDPPAALAAEVRQRLRRVGPMDRATEAVSASLRAGRCVTATADVVGLGPRQLHRLSLRAFGYGPKTLANVLRFDRAVALARTGTPFATVAAAAGYADQAHLSRDVRRFAGLPLGALVGARR